LFEAQRRLGGQALLAQLLPGRAEFGGLVTNLQRELENAGVEVRTGTRVDRALIDREAPDAVIAATGARPYWPAFAREGDLQVVDAWQVLQGSVTIGHSVVVIDWRADWIGIGIAAHLAAERPVGAPRGQRHRGRRDSAASTCAMIRRSASLHTLGVSVLPYMRLYGSDSNSVYLQHIASGEAVVIDAVDTLVLCTGHSRFANSPTHSRISAAGLRIIGDAAAPRTAEEAVFEGLQAAVAL
jgi:hypothetical protein